MAWTCSWEKRCRNLSWPRMNQPRSRRHPSPCLPNHRQNLRPRNQSLSPNRSRWRSRILLNHPQLPKPHRPQSQRPRPQNRLRLLLAPRSVQPHEPASSEETLRRERRRERLAARRLALKAGEPRDRHIHPLLWSPGSKDQEPCASPRTVAGMYLKLLLPDQSIRSWMPTRRRLPERIGKVRQIRRVRSL